MNRREMTLGRGPRRRGRKRGSVNRLTTMMIDTIVLLANDPDRLLTSMCVWGRVSPKAYLRLMMLVFLEPEFRSIGGRAPVEADPGTGAVEGGVWSHV